MFVQTADDGVRYDRHDPRIGDVTERVVLVIPRSARRSLQVITRRRSHAFTDVYQERVGSCSILFYHKPIDRVLFPGGGLRFAI